MDRNEIQEIIRASYLTVSEDHVRSDKLEKFLRSVDGKDDPPSLAEILAGIIDFNRHFSADLLLEVLSRVFLDEQLP